MVSCERSIEALSVRYTLAARLRTKPSLKPERMSSNATRSSLLKLAMIAYLK